MGLDPKALPESILRLMAKEDRAPLGKGGLTMKEANEVHDKRLEKELQRDMANLLNQRDLFYLRSRMDKRTSLPNGMPDFFIFLPNGKFLAVEAKVFGGSVSEDQKRMFQKFSDQTGQPVHVAWNLESFKTILDIACRPLESIPDL